jgi:hypothetical protein
MSKSALSLVTASLLLASNAYSQQAGPPQAGPSRVQIAEACGGDIDRLCPGVPPGQGRIKACMRAHVSELSAQCFDTLMAAAAAKKE